MLADFMLALALFWGVVFAVSNSDIRAHAVPLPAVGKQAIDPNFAFPSRVSALGHAGPWQVRASQVPNLALLSLAFAALMAGNLAFWRHLRRVYASPRRNVWRRG
jgi:hypothetical protein